MEDKLANIGQVGKGKKSRPEPKNLDQLKNPFQHGFVKVRLREDLFAFNAKLNNTEFRDMMVSTIRIPFQYSIFITTMKGCRNRRVVMNAYISAVAISPS
jgi:hypothetical protein